jgi:hypothetical protein
VTGRDIIIFDKIPIDKHIYNNNQSLNVQNTCCKSTITAGLSRRTDNTMDNRKNDKQLSTKIELFTEN